MGPEARKCQNCQADFAIEPEDFNFYEKIQVPPPTFCPTCRLRRRLLFRNERNIYRKKDDSDGKEIISGFPEESWIKVYNRDYWWSDSWDALTYGRDYDFSRTFFEQYKDLMAAVPWVARSVVNMVNSDYSEQAGNCKNAYLCFNCDYIEDSCYVIRVTYAKSSIDILQSMNAEYCYDSAMIVKGHRVFYSLNCEECTDTWFSKNCVGCNHCFGCVNLRGKSYYIFNQPYSKEEYHRKIEEMRLGTWSGREKAREATLGFWRGFPERFMHGIKNTATTGEYMFNTKNVRECYYVEDAENAKWCQMVNTDIKDSYDYTVWGMHSSQMYESITCGDQNDRLRFCFECWPGNNNLEYCISCHSCEDCFGCVGLRKKQYCIFNKQYDREEYEALRQKIMGQMAALPYKSVHGHSYGYGEFFPPELSPLAYNETMALDHFPLNKEEVAAQGYLWRDPRPKTYTATAKAADLPDDIADAADGILAEIIACGQCGEVYRIVRDELAFYRQMQVPLPRKCMECRFRDRFQLLNPMRLWDRTCMCAGGSSGNYKNISEHDHGQAPCGRPFRTSFAPDRPDIVYCEECYQKEVS